MKSRCAPGSRQTRTAGSLAVALTGLVLVGFLPAQAFARGKSKAADTEGKAAKGGKAGSKEVVHACGVIYETAKARAQAAHLREAKELLGKCARVQCGSFLQQECTTLYTQMDADIPSVVPVVTDAAGQPRALVEVKMDGEMLTSKLDGHAIPVDPGKHEFSFATDSGVFATLKVMIVQGQRNRTIAVSMVPGKKAPGEKAAPEAGGEGAAVATEGGGTETPKVAEPTKPEPELVEAEAELAAAAEEGADSKASTKGTVIKSKTPTMAWVAAGVAVTGLVGYGLFTYWGRKDNDLLVGCADGCDPAGQTHVRNLYLAADISLGVGLVAAGISTYLFAKPHYTREKASVQTAYIDVQPTPSGALASVGGVF